MENTGSRDYFNQVASRWDELQKSYYDESILVAARKKVPISPDMVVADIGAGTGFITKGIAPYVSKVIALDQSPEMLKEMARNMTRLDIGNVEYKQGILERLPLPDNEVNVAFANMVLHHAFDPQKAIREMARILKPGGWLVITDGDRHEHEWMRTELHDVWLGFERADVKGWFEGAGLTSVDVDCVGSECCATSEAGEGARVSIFIAVGQKVLR